MSGPISPELQTKIANWRMRAASNELTLEEMKEAIVYLRAGRVAAASAQATARKKRPASEAPKADDMLGELEGM